MRSQILLPVLPTNGLLFSGQRGPAFYGQAALRDSGQLGKYTRQAVQGQCFIAEFNPLVGRKAGLHRRLCVTQNNGAHLRVVDRRRMDLSNAGGNRPVILRPFEGGTPQRTRIMHLDAVEAVVEHCVRLA